MPSGQKNISNTRLQNQEKYFLTMHSVHMLRQSSASA